MHVCAEGRASTSSEPLVRVNTGSKPSSGTRDEPVAMTTLPAAEKVVPAGSGGASAASRAGAVIGAWRAAGTAKAKRSEATVVPSRSSSRREGGATEGDGGSIIAAISGKFVGKEWV